VSFGLVYDKEEALVNRFDVKDFPTFIGIKEDEVKVYDGKVDFAELAEFVEEYKGQFKKAPKKKEPSKPKNTDSA